MKKILKLMLALALTSVLIASNMDTSAAGTHSITINNSTAGHTYEAYQIFTGDLSQDKTTLSNIQWGSNMSSSYTSGKTASVIAGYIENEKAEDGTTARTAAEWATVIESALSNANPAGTANTVVNGVYTITGLAEGYYLIKDKDNTLGGENDAYTEFILMLVGDAEVNPKSGIPTATKMIDEATDTAYSAQYRVGDTVDFILTGTMPSNYGNYSSYKYTLHDKSAAGLTVDTSSIKVYVGSTEITSGFTIDTSPSDNDTFDVVFANTKSISSINSNSEIIVKYTATVNSNATIGSTGNSNELKIDFSNNPNDPSEIGTTTVSAVKVYLYNITINKLDENNAALNGAKFKLERLIDATNNTWETVDEINGTNSNTFTFTGLGLGTYRLTETTTPDGYNTIDPVTIVVTGTVNNTGFTSLSATGLSFTANLTNGTLTANIQNIPGSVLPFTGGIGATIFTILGIGFIAGGVAIAVRKTNKKESK